MYIEAPGRIELKVGTKSIFLAGGITGCPNWQPEMAHWILDNTDLAVLNPCRKNFPIENPGAAPEQIRWEHNALRKTDIILFWFPCETLCPITLYELGAWSMTTKPILVGMHPDYQKRLDVEIQTGLVRPEIEIVYSLDTLAAQVIKWLEEA